jgi:hypothetical protein
MIHDLVNIRYVFPVPVISHQPPLGLLAKIYTPFQAGTGTYPSFFYLAPVPTGRDGLQPTGLLATRPCRKCRYPLDGNKFHHHHHHQPPSPPFLLPPPPSLLRCPLKDSGRARNPKVHTSKSPEYRNRWSGQRRPPLFFSCQLLRSSRQRSSAERCPIYEQGHAWAGINFFSGAWI